MKKLTSVDDEAIDAGFGWGALDSNPDIDIWAVRIPAGVSVSVTFSVPRHLLRPYS